YVDETSQECRWHLPQAHYLEAWGDARAFDGTASIVQPLIEPLYQGKSPAEVMALFFQDEEQSGRQIVRSYWRRQWTSQRKAGNQEQGKTTNSKKEGTSDRQRSKGKTTPESDDQAFER